MTERADELAAYLDRCGYRYFRGHEVARFCERPGNSVPGRGLWPGLAQTLAVLDRVREMLGAPIVITSAYRDARYNQSVGGSAQSQHMRGRALDWKCRRGEPEYWARVVRGLRGHPFFVDDVHFVFRGGVGVYDTFVHMDTRGVDYDWQG